ncbi:hypothetical protein [Autumnicola psychrophila]|uniref:Uncharacterized protein n=1 Tax=Autumnicola psychrophila TaxID=3075592 RepID=A0ABU3DTN5_9FLAO|nr:hypothetical protein [Zunongwangia sp. F225]MDT0687079.1 hypothetical protein [Zunongwangia sp. F225]
MKNGNYRPYLKYEVRSESYGKKFSHFSFRRSASKMAIIDLQNSWVLGVPSRT